MPSRAGHELEAARIKVLTEARTDYHELQFLEVESRVVAEDRATLEHYAELALARYASGVGLDQAVIKIQAEITRTDTRLLNLAARRATVVARLNALRDRPQTTPVVVADAQTRPTVALDLGELRQSRARRSPGDRGGERDGRGGRLTGGENEKGLQPKGRGGAQLRLREPPG